MRTRMTPEERRASRLAAGARYRANNLEAKERRRWLDRIRNASRPGVAAKQSRKWRESHPGYDAQWRANHKERCRAINKKSKQKNKDKIKKTWQSWWKRKGAAYTRKRKYGITQDEFNKIAQAQNERCACCGKKKTLVVDHCHKYGHIRGLICGNCNSAAGLIGDTSSGALALYGYLSKTQLPLDI